MKKGDKIAAILLISLIIVSFIGVFIYKTYVKGSNRIAVVEQNGKIVKTIDLNKIKEKSEFILPYNNGHFNKIEVEPGKIRFIDADCPDKICVKTGWISEPGQTAVCLPHKTIIRIEGKNSSYDQISS
ncbi:NusG domain II-containing protein [Clostridiaceae bacterium UIB06]|uniref:NusG domain II-containing protein n=1 Tax=Clostridium thailandense TaxID=2794346 RepID=A0A949TQQ9_9CLOT|nr:NusG domain II-containing protein [Clostridium thailandense]MBV7276795.1 NusG domain II-containing protein [Clostridium thailandense]MCH5136615.1 NusG domain II-containing protein [Clostridiaceae bacterium UIB06]